MGSWAAWVLDSLPYSQSRREGKFPETLIQPAESLCSSIGSKAWFTPWQASYSTHTM